MHLKSKMTRFDVIMAREDKKLKHMTRVVEAMEIAVYIWCGITAFNIISLIWENYLATLQ